MQTSIASATVNLFGVYSARGAFALLRSISRFSSLLCVFMPVYLMDWQTELILYWVITGFMGCGLIMASFLNPYALVEEPRKAFEKLDSD